MVAHPKKAWSTCKRKVASAAHTPFCLHYLLPTDFFCALLAYNTGHLWTQAVCEHSRLDVKDCDVSVRGSPISTALERVGNLSSRVSIYPGAAIFSGNIIPSLIPSPLPAAILQWSERWSGDFGRLSLSQKSIPARIPAGQSNCRIAQLLHDHDRRWKKVSLSSVLLYSVPLN